MLSSDTLASLASAAKSGELRDSRRAMNTSEADLSRALGSRLRGRPGRALRVAGITALFGVKTLSAQVAEPTDTVPIPLPPIQVRVVLGDDVRHTPGAASTLTRIEIQRLRPYTLHDLFDFVPGVRTIDDDALGLRSGIGVRGAPPRRSRKTLLLEDGSPINGSSYLDPSAHYTPPAERVERIEVLKGAGQLAHGPLNNHGVINFRNISPTSEGRTVISLSGGELSTFRRHVSHTGTYGGNGVALAYTGMNADGTFDVEHHQFDDFHVGAARSLGAANDVAASFTYFRERSEGYDESNLTPEQFALDPRGKAVLDQGREYNNISVDYYKVDVAHDARPAEALTVSTKAFLRRMERPRFQTRGTAPTANGVMEGRDRRYGTMGLESRVEIGRLRAVRAEHSLQGGARIERHTFDDLRPIGRPGEALGPAFRGDAFARAGVDGYTRSGRVTEFRADAVSAFLQDVIRLRDWSITPGVRIESYSQRRDVVYWPGNPDEGIAIRDRNTLVLPGASVLYHGSRAGQLYAGVHRGFAPAIARTEEFPLLPETGINSQIGIRSRSLSGTEAEIALFFNRIDDTLIRTDVDHFGDGLFVNTAGSRVYGVDVGMSWSTADSWNAAHQLSAELAYNYSRAEFRNGPLAGNRVPEIPDHAGSLTLGVERSGRWRASATASHFGHFFADIENTREITADAGRVPGRTLVSARGEYTLPSRPSATLWLQGRNLANRLYIADVQDGLRPGAPRSIVGGVSLSF
jgi:Fe(3+) dicitrate transport protein